METIYFALPGNEVMAFKLATDGHAEYGKLQVRSFPDGETYVRVLSRVKNKQVVLVCSLDHPDTKILPLYFLSNTMKALGAKKIILVAPYLAYMRQDKAFNPGEGLTSVYFAKIISGLADQLITIDSHLHRTGSLSDIYSVPAINVIATDCIAQWIRGNVKDPLIIGPDAESEQWVSKVAKSVGAPFVILQKTRHGDRSVEVSIPAIQQFSNRTPVVMDDIISTGKTMIETIQQLKILLDEKPVCIGIHAVFAGNAYEELENAGAADIVTCNTIPHPSNRIDISGLLRIS